MAAKFKKGDRVRLKVDRFDIADLRAGDTGTLREDDDGAPFIDWGRIGDYWAVDSSQIELVPVAKATGTDAEPKFKVGDRVKFRDDYGSSARGTEATVVKVDSWGIMVDGVHGKSTEQLSSLRLVAEATSGKFMVGDRVRIASGPNNGGFGQIGDTGVIEIVGKTNCLVRFKTGGRDGEAWYVGFDYLEHAKPAPLTIQAGKFYRTRDGRKVGPMYEDDCGDEYPWTADNGGYYDAYGVRQSLIEGDSGTLIAEWADEPADKALDEVVNTIFGWDKRETPNEARADAGLSPLPANDNSTAGFTIPVDAYEADLTAIGKAYADGYAAGLAARQAA